MAVANQFDKPIEHHTWRAIRSAMLKRQADEIAPEAIDRFIAPARTTETTGRYAAALARTTRARANHSRDEHARCLLQFNQYHKYTVDAHSIRAVECVTDLQDDDSLLGIIYRGLPDKRICIWLS